MISLGVPQNTFLSMEEQSIMITNILLGDKVRATLLQCSHTVITFMELTRAIGTRNGTLPRFSKSSTPPDFVCLHVHGRPFYANRKHLVARSGKLASLIKQPNIGQTGDSTLSQFLKDMPADSTIFEQVIKFCYGFEVNLSAENIIPLICAAWYLEMTENCSPNNLLTKAVSFFQLKVLPQWNESLKAFKSTEEVFKPALDLRLVDACIDSLVKKAQLNPCYLGEPIRNAMSTREDDQRSEEEDEKDDKNYMSKIPRRKLFVLDMESEDLVILPPRLYRLLIVTMIEVGIRSEYIVGSVFRYMNKYINGATIDLDDEYDDDDHQVRYKNMFQREVIEILEKLLPNEVGLIPCKLLFKMLQSAIALQASSNCREGLEIRIGKQLNEATVEDLSIPSSLVYAIETKFDIECFKRIVKIFYANCTSVEDTGKMIKVAELVSEFLGKVASDEELSKNTFISLAAIVEGIFIGMKQSFDAIYQAIDVYLDNHRNLTESEREEVCQVLDCHKMSPEACTHAAQNERLPLRFVVQALFVGQLHLREVIINKVECSDYGSQEFDHDHRVVVGGGGDGDEEKRLDDDDDDGKVMEREKKCDEMKGSSMEKRSRGSNKGSLNVWKKFKRKFGCMSSRSSYEDNCYVKKKLHRGH